MTLAPSLAAFGRLLSDADLRQRLSQELDVSAAAQALDLTEPGSRSEPVRLDRSPPPGWLPAMIDGDRVVWRWFGRQVLDDGFYEHELQTAGYLAINRLFAVETPLSALMGALPTEGRAPDGLVFHMSRCGSTLIARMLAADPDATVISEAQPIDAAVRSGDPMLLRAVAAAFARPRGIGEARLFLKLDCWNSRAIPLFQAAFPDTPWIFSHREPAEVMVSHARRVGSQMVSELVPASVFGLEAGGNPLDPAYHAAVLASVCEGALEGWTAGGGALVDHRELPEAVVSRVLPHFRVTSTPDVEAAMRAMGGMNAKAKEEAFTPDGESKRREIGPAIRAACDGRLADFHARLRRLTETGVA